LGNGLPKGSPLTINTRFSADVPPVMVDPQGLREVIWNLCLNAVEAMDHRGTLMVRTAVQRLPPRVLRADAEPLTASHELIIEVTDTGPGIPPEMKEKIFEPFYSTKKGGTGLGLATVERLISKHNGRIEVESEPRRGTTMRIHLPLRHAGLSDAGQE